MKNLYQDLAKFAKYHLRQSPFLVELPVQVCNFTKKRLYCKCFPVNFIWATASIFLEKLMSIENLREQRSTQRVVRTLIIIYTFWNLCFSLNSYQRPNCFAENPIFKKLLWSKTGYYNHNFESSNIFKIIKSQCIRNIYFKNEAQVV